MDYWKRKSQDLTEIAKSWWTFIFLNGSSLSLELAAIAFADCLESHESKDECIKRLKNEKTDLEKQLRDKGDEVHRLNKQLALAEQMMLDFSKRMIAQVQGGDE